MRKFKLSPFVEYCYEGTLNDFYYLITKANVVVYSIDFVDNAIYFKIDILDEWKLLKVKEFKKIKLEGLLGFIYKQLHSLRRILGIITFTMVIVLLHNYCFELKIVSDDSLLEEEIEKIILAKNIKVWSNEICHTIENELKYDYFDMIEWLNITKEGSYVEIEVKKREKIAIKENTYDSLYSYKEGVIAAFDVKSGNKLVELNDYVKVGDELVSGSFLDSSGNLQNTYVLGKVYAYTYNEVEMEMVWPYDIELTKGWAFYNLLYKFRQIIGVELSYDEMIVEENILHFSSSEGTIKMKILYTLYEDITHP